MQKVHNLIMGDWNTFCILALPLAQTLPGSFSVLPVGLVTTS